MKLVSNDIYYDESLFKPMQRIVIDFDVEAMQHAKNMIECSEFENILKEEFLNIIRDKV